MQKSVKIFPPLLVLTLFLNYNVIASVSANTFKEDKDSSRKASKQNNGAADQESGFHPVLRVGGGLLSYIGNVKSGAGTSNFQSPASGRGGFDIGLSQRLSNTVEFGVNFLDGTLAETERTTSATWNFKASIIGGGFNLLFKFLPKQEMTPYFLIGVETFGFTSNADINDPNGNPYYTWSDGTLRSLPQNSANASQAKILNLDYNYSTDIRSLNLDGSGNYTEQTFAIPVGLGFMFSLGTQADFMIGSTLHYTFTDHIDGLTPQVQGPLQGTLSHDMFLFTYISLRIHLTREHAKSPEEEHEVTITPYLMKDTVHAAPEGHFDTSQTVLQKQYDQYSDTSGKYAKVHVDPFQWKNPTPSAAPAESNPPTTGNKPAVVKNPPATGNAPATKKSANAAPAAPSNNTTSTTGTIYKVQLLATKTKLPDGTNFAGINDQIAVAENNGTYFYTTGNYTDRAEAVKYMEQLRAFGYADAFVTKSGGAAPAAPAKPKQNSTDNKKGQSSFNDTKESKELPVVQQKQVTPSESQVNISANATASVAPAVIEKKKA